MLKIERKIPPLRTGATTVAIRVPSNVDSTNQSVQWFNSV